MRRMVPRRAWAARALVALAALAVVQMGAGPGKKKKETPPKIEETVGDLSFVIAKGQMTVEGVGLVIGLDDTGGDAPSSWYRKQLVDEMSKAGVEKPEKLLTSHQVSMVMVKLTIPTGVGPKDPLDAQVEVPAGCPTKSLAGGYLLLTRLREVLIAGGSPKSGHELALAQGPVMLGTPAKPNDPKVGRVLGGGRVKKSHPYTLVIKENRESVRTTKMLETVINERFHQYEDGHQKGVATAKTPSYLELKVPALYHQNQDHYFGVVRNLQMIDSPELRQRRIALWSKQLLDPTTAGIAALKLEGAGVTAVDALKDGLKSKNAQVRFFSAESLAYLDDPAGVEALGEAAIHQTTFRTYALAALSATDQPASHGKLRKLMDEPDFEVRYGAFNALRTLDPHDPFLGRVRVFERKKQDDEDENDSSDAMALAMTKASQRRRNQPEDPFALYVVDSEGPPLVHVSRSRRSEIVIFGHRQTLLPPVVLGAGPVLLNASDNDEQLEVSKIVPSRAGDADVRITTSLDLAEVIKKTANLGATYPEVVTILESAFRQKNLPGDLVVDAVPIPRREYTDALLGKDLTAKRDESVKRTSTPPRQSRLWPFRIFSRNADSAAETTLTPASAKSTSSSTATSRSSTGTVNQPRGNAAGDSATDDDDASGKGGDHPAAPASVKKDDAVQKATGDDSPPPRKSLLDFLRGRDDS